MLFAYRLSRPKDLEQLVVRRPKLDFDHVRGWLEQRVPRPVLVCGPSTIFGDGSPCFPGQLSSSAPSTEMPYFRSSLWRYLRSMSASRAALEMFPSARVISHVR